ncbi:ATP-binding protein [Methanospirillum purgamenti]|jgi:serine/threonine-protein kinase RsbW|uniref:ATP-binding protein n=1 Tax=Methanospirillum hungatei TaxID=2203 RepID=A0A8F5ZI99_METHU|nr:ATP-binding protein [Methanospirillum hungatei]NLW77604.1 ATP-binding protein [Methanomicrobiales archaeon]QXO95968.1 ATP-binding protein [Methanospirillum hungatei]
MATYQINLTDPEHAVTQLADFLSEILEAENSPPDVENAMQLAAEEAVVNIMNHGYKGGPGLIEIRCIISAHQVVLCIRDEAPFFNPLTLPTPDTEAGIDERRIGGLGVHLIRSLMDEVTYKQTESGNCLIMKKNRAH